MNEAPAPATHGSLIGPIQRLLRIPPPNRPPDYQNPVLASFAAAVNRGRARVYEYETACWAARRDTLLHILNKGVPKFCSSEWIEAATQLGEVASLAEHHGRRLPTFEQAIAAGIHHAETAARQGDSAMIVEMSRQVAVIGVKFSVPWWIAAEMNKQEAADGRS